MQDFIMTGTGLRDNAPMVKRNIYPWLDQEWPNIPTVKDPGLLFEAIEGKKSIVVGYNNEVQLKAHIKTAFGLWALQHWHDPEGWKLRYEEHDPNSFVDTVLSNECSHMFKVPVIILMAPEWPTTLKSMEHADYGMRMRQVRGRSTLFCTRSLSDIVDRKPATWYERAQVKGDPAKRIEAPAVHPGFREFLVDDSDVLKVTLFPKKFKDEIKHLHGAILEDIL